MKNIKELKIKVIAEIGVNHNGKLSIAKKLIRESKKCGADFVKFQIYEINELTTEYAKKASYQNKNDGRRGNQYEMLKRLNFSLNEFKILKEYCKKIRIKFLASAFDIPSLKKLNSLKLNYFKIPSGEITNAPYLKYLANLKKKVFLSTGMSTLRDVEYAVELLMKNGLKKNQITVMQCISNYPTKISDLNLNVLKTFKNKFNLQLGFSDHTTSLEAPLFAIFNGATVIEKHITLNKEMKGPDHKASLNIKEFKKMMQNIHDFQISLGSSEKKPNNEEKKISLLVRKSIVAKKKIKKGEVLNKFNLACKRPGYGISPKKFSQLINKKSNKDYDLDDMIDLKI
jgi:N,N'-diacetyllegionaminate synthase